MCNVLLNVTAGKTAIPIFERLVLQYPRIEDLAAASQEDVYAIISSLGLGNQRARRLITMAKIWVEDPPRARRLHRTKDYPGHNDGRDLALGTVLEDAAPRDGALEIGHIPGLGRYAFDSFRMFCADRLRGLAHGYNGEGTGVGFEAEWKRVNPSDKELRAWKKWAFLCEGIDWDPVTNGQVPADRELLRFATEGGLILEDSAQRFTFKARDKVTEEMIDSKTQLLIGESPV